MNIWDKYVLGKSAGWTAILIMVFTGILAWVAYKANENSVTTQRAFVNFNGITGMKVMRADSKGLAGINFFVNWTNSGTTPTKTATGQVNIQSWRSELPKGFNYADLATVEKRAFVIGPKATVSQLVGVTIDDIKDVREGKSHLYLWGWLAYHDIFPGTPNRLTEFCVEITNLVSTKPDVTDPSAEFTYILVPCGKHNCYDEDCPDYKSRTKITIGGVSQKGNGISP